MQDVIGVTVGATGSTNAITNDYFFGGGFQNWYLTAGLNISNEGTAGAGGQTISYTPAAGVVSNMIAGYAASNISGRTGTSFDKIMPNLGAGGTSAMNFIYSGGPTGAIYVASIPYNFSSLSLTFWVDRIYNLPVTSGVSTMAPDLKSSVLYYSSGATVVRYDVITGSTSNLYSPGLGAIRSMDFDSARSILYTSHQTSGGTVAAAYIRPYDRWNLKGIGTQTSFTLQTYDCPSPEPIVRITSMAVDETSGYQYFYTVTATNDYIVKVDLQNGRLLERVPSNFTQDLGRTSRDDIVANTFNSGAFVLSTELINKTSLQSTSNGTVVFSPATSTSVENMRPAFYPFR